MQEVTYYICEVCGRQSRSKGGTKNHERACIRKRQDEHRRFESRKQAQYEFLESVRSPEEIHIRTIKWMKKWNNIDFEIIQENLRYSDKTSNTHCCPINGVTNWEVKEDKPIGYPGWTAHWIIGMSDKTYKKIDFFSGFLRGHYYPNEKMYSLLGIHTGSGGTWSRPKDGKQETYSHYYMTFFADDFPNLQRWLLKAKLKEGTGHEIERILWQGA